ncbi:MAG: response regulator transcription factor, partial [Pseudomonadota bacterium]
MVEATPIRILIVDDHLIVRERLRALLSDEQSIEVVGEAADAQSAISIAKSAKPDIILMDFALLGKSGIEAAAAISKTITSARTILLTNGIGDNDSLQGAGVMGCLQKDVSKNELLSTIKNVHPGAPGHDRITPKTPMYRVGCIRQPHDDLTARERDILKEIASGKSNKIIARDLNLTEGTVKGYVSVVLSKLGVDDRAKAAL